jgi:hypothetical protein
MSKIFINFALSNSANQNILQTGGMTIRAPEKDSADLIGTIEGNTTRPRHREGLPQFERRNDLI